MRHRHLKSSEQCTQAGRTHRPAWRYLAAGAFRLFARNAVREYFAVVRRGVVSLRRLHCVGNAAQRGFMLGWCHCAEDRDVLPGGELLHAGDMLTSTGSAVRNISVGKKHADVRKDAALAPRNHRKWMLWVLRWKIHGSSLFHFFAAVRRKTSAATTPAPTSKFFTRSFASSCFAAAVCAN